MKEIGTNELRELQMQILDYVDAFCRKHDIRYTISGGTLLGAVRHGGYIPWDDDIDIQMKRDEYNRFTELWNKEKVHHRYIELVNIESGNNMGYPFGKVHDTRTVTFLGKYERTGVYIDIFPVDGVKDEEDFRNRHEQIKQLYIQRFHILEKTLSRMESFNLKRFIRMLLHPVPHKTYNQIAEEINTLAQLNSHMNCPYAFEMISGLKCKQPIPTEVFSEYTDIKFENRNYMSVRDFDKYLTLTFGDYMTPPPTKKRTKHLFTAYWR